ncbi:MAG: hypothetical protein ACPG7F_13820, partial [Aggregatilineales bacterium]
LSNICSIRGENDSFSYLCENIETQFDAETILPDKTKYNPVLGKAQLERFINPDRTDFWQPGWVRVWNYTGRVPRWLGRWYRDES